MTTPRLTIGSATHDDFEGVYFSYQALRLANPELLDELEFIIIDNNPSSSEGKATADFCKKAKIKYFAEPRWKSTAVRDLIFEKATAPFTMSMDSHVLFEPDGIKRLLAFLEERPETNDLFHGVMMYDSLHGLGASSMKPEWRDAMFGTWNHEEKAADREAEPYEIPLHGLGCFACRTEAWAGFSPLFKGFGGEEGYIHEKFRQRGDTTWCLPFLRWVHRFQRPRGVAYELRDEDRVRNYALGWLELGKPMAEILEHFAEARPTVETASIIAEARNQWNDFKKNPEATVALVHEKPREELAPAIEFPEKKGLQYWHTTNVGFANPIEVNIFGRLLSFSKASVTWSIR